MVAKSVVEIIIETILSTGNFKSWVLGDLFKRYSNIAYTELRREWVVLQGKVSPRQAMDTQIEIESLSFKIFFGVTIKERST